MNNKPRIGFSFSGGGARATAQIGVLKAFEEHGIKAERVAGTSGGAIVASLYAAGLSNEEMVKFAKEGSLLKLFKLGLPIRGLTSLDYLEKLLASYIGKLQFEDLDIPLSVTASNLLSGTPVFFNSGPLYPAIQASCAVPLVFKPIEIDGILYADGGIFNNLPVAPLRTHCDIIIGINVMPMMEFKSEQLESMLSIGLRVFEMAISQNTKVNIPHCNIVIEPKAVVKHGVFNFGSSASLFKIGYEAAMEQMEDILKMLS